MRIFLFILILAIPSILNFNIERIKRKRYEEEIKKLQLEVDRLKAIGEERFWERDYNPSYYLLIKFFHKN